MPRIVFHGLLGARKIFKGSGSWTAGGGYKSSRRRMEHGYDRLGRWLYDRAVIFQCGIVRGALCVSCSVA